MRINPGFGQSPKHHDDMVLSAGEDRAAFLAAGFLKLPFSARHAEVMESLLSHHADPFGKTVFPEESASLPSSAKHSRSTACAGLSGINYLEAPTDADATPRLRKG